jgi:HEAT repeat protein
MFGKKSPKSSTKRYTTTASAKSVVAEKPATKVVEVTLPPAAAAAAVIATPPVAQPQAKVNKPDNSAVIAQLIAALRGSDADEACDAGTALGTQGDASAVQPLIEVLMNADGYFHPVVRAAAAASLGKLGDARAVDALIHAVADSIDEPSVEAIRALGVLGDKRAVPALIGVIRNADGFFLPVARRAAVVALARFQGEPSVTELKAVAANESETAEIREAATAALAPAKKSA